MTATKATKTAIRAGQPSWSGYEQDFVGEVLRSGWLTQGQWVARFEREFAKWVGAKYGVATTSGTTALHLVMASLLRPGDEVIVPAITFVATANAARYCGARLVFADIDPMTWTIDPADVEARITHKTRMIVPVHLYGVPADMEALEKLAYIYNLALVEDCAEGIGARIGAGMRHVGTFGDAGIFSFYGNKTITTGEGGMIVTNDAALAQDLRHLRGQAMTERRYWHDQVGFNYRMTEMQAALGCAQMAIIDDVVARRAQVAAWYEEALASAGIDFCLQQARADDKHGNWAVAGLMGEGIPKERLMAHLASEGIETRPVFPLISEMPMYRRADTFAYAGGTAWRGVVLPTHAEMSRGDVERVVDVMRTFLESVV